MTCPEQPPAREGGARRKIALGIRDCVCVCLCVYACVCVCVCVIERERQLKRLPTLYRVPLKISE